MEQQNITEQLKLAWDRAVVAGKLINEFEAARDDTQKQWEKGDRITFGITQQDSHNRYTAHNLTQNREIQSAVEEREIGQIGPGQDFTCQFNGYRALRPGGASKPLGRQPDISAAPEDCRFACQDSTRPLSLLAREPLFTQPLQHFIWNAYYNAAPIEPNGHFLWVPTRNPNELTHLTQALSLPILEDALTLFKQLSSSLLFFNSLHAGASVNHIHFQSIVSQHRLPAETYPLTQKTTAITSYATPEDYPAFLMMFEPNIPASQIFPHIDQLQTNGVPFNLMITPRFTILIPRNIDFEVVSEFPGNGLAGLGMCGRIITIDRAAYQNANHTDIRNAFQKMSKLP